jgi:hypothetical protein
LPWLLDKRPLDIGKIKTPATLRNGRPPARPGHRRRPSRSAMSARLNESSSAPRRSNVRPGRGRSRAGGPSSNRRRRSTRWVRVSNKKCDIHDNIKTALGFCIRWSKKPVPLLIVYCSWLYQ